MRKLDRIMSNKYTLITIIMMLTWYPVMELSRCIYVYNLRGSWIYQSSMSNSYLELAIIWMGYLLIPVILGKVLKKGRGNGHKRASGSK